MISAINSTRFASANNYKRTYTNTNQNINQSAVGYQQSFGMRRTSLLLTVLGALLSFSPANFARAAEKGAGKLAGESCMETVASYTAQLAKLGERGETTNSGLIGKSVTYTTPYTDASGTKVGEFSETKIVYGKGDEELAHTNITKGNETCSDTNADGVLDICFRNVNGVTQSKEKYNGCEYQEVMTIPSFSPRRTFKPIQPSRQKNRK